MDTTNTAAAVKIFVHRVRPENKDRALSALRSAGFTASLVKAPDYWNSLLDQYVPAEGMVGVATDATGKQAHQLWVDAGFASTKWFGPAKRLRFPGEE